MTFHDEREHDGANRRTNLHHGSSSTYGYFDSLLGNLLCAVLVEGAHKLLGNFVGVTALDVMEAMWGGVDGRSLVAIQNVGASSRIFVRNTASPP